MGAESRLLLPSRATVGAAAAALLRASRLPLDAGVKPRLAIAPGMPALCRRALPKNGDCSSGDGGGGVEAGATVPPPPRAAAAGLPPPLLAMLTVRVKRLKKGRKSTGVCAAVGGRPLAAALPAAPGVSPGVAPSTAIVRKQRRDSQAAITQLPFALEVVWWARERPEEGCMGQM